MKILIIEDERNAAIDLQQMLMTLEPSFMIEGITDSIESSLEWLEEFGQPDLIFSDIQLADGLSFEIFKRYQVTCPIIFTTAYDEYAIQAFETNGISYLLKPTDEKKVAMSLKKVEELRVNLSGKSDNYIPGANQLSGLLKSIQETYKSYKTSLMIAYKSKIFPVNVTDIACFTIKHAVTSVHTLQGKSYSISQTLEELEQSLDPLYFYRANRQNLVAFKAIKEVEPYFGRKILVHLVVPTEEKLFVSKPRSSHFLEWMENR